MPRLIQIATLSALDDLLASSDGPVLLYKHSTTCGRSAFAYEEIRDLVSERGADVTVGIVNVQAARAVSQEIARRFGVRHESPQVILLIGGKAAWSASHHGVTADAIRAALQATVFH